MIKTIKSVLGILLFGYLIIFFDAHILGYSKSIEKIISTGYRIGRSRGSADRYWMYTSEGKINVDYNLYAALGINKTIQVYRSEIFHTPLKIDNQLSDKIDSYNTCFTRTKSGFALMSLFFTITLIPLLLIDRGTYKPGKIGIAILLIVLFLITLGDHVYA
jgi:hypothetical protein